MRSCHSWTRIYEIKYVSTAWFSSTYFYCCRIKGFLYYMLFVYIQNCVVSRLWVSANLLELNDVRNNDTCNNFYGWCWRNINIVHFVDMRAKIPMITLQDVAGPRANVGISWRSPPPPPPPPKCSLPIYFLPSGLCKRYKSRACLGSRMCPLKSSWERKAAARWRRAGRTYNQCVSRYS